MFGMGARSLGDHLSRGLKLEGVLCLECGGAHIGFALFLHIRCSFKQHPFSFATGRTGHLYEFSKHVNYVFS